MKDTNLIIGKINTGKTRNILFNEVNKAISNNENLFIFDDRDEYYITYSKKLKESGYNVLTLNLKNPLKSNGYNPLLVPYKLYKENRKDEAISMITNMALEIFKSNNINADPFWQNMAANYFSGLALILFNEADEEEINIGSIQTIMMQSENKYNDSTYMKTYLETLDINNPIYILLSSVVFAPNDTRGSILSVVKQKLNLYVVREQLLNLLNTNEIDLAKIHEKTAIFIIGKEDISDIANIFINQLISNAAVPFIYIFDNFDSLKTVLSIKELLSDASYNKNKVFVSVHSADAIKEKYGNLIIDKFQNVLLLNDDEKYLYELGNDDEYPTLNKKQHNYFNFEKFMKRR